MSFAVLNVDGEPIAAKAGPQGINDQDPESVIEFAARVCRPEAEALFCSCTAWRSLEVVEALEKRTGKPVVTSNQATIWAAFRQIGIRQPIHGFGKLLESLAAEVALV
jgi:maleate isomerase